MPTSHPPKADTMTGLGKGAHTHYYEARMARVAQEIDRLTLG